MGTLEYSSNNSGGNWWLNDDDWKALEEAGWKVEWVKDSEHYSKYSDAGRWLGALAMRASVECDSADEGIAQWESITGEYADSEGCNCCGQPHYFTFTGDDGETKSRYLETRSSGYWS